jgi:hypothetical protein
METPEPVYVVDEFDRILRLDAEGTETYVGYHGLPRCGRCGGTRYLVQMPGYDFRYHADSDPCGACREEKRAWRRANELIPGGDGLNEMANEAGW